MGVGGRSHVPAALPPGKTRYPLYRKLGRPQGRSVRVRKTLPPPGFDPRTVQPVASRYTLQLLSKCSLELSVMVVWSLFIYLLYYGTKFNRTSQCLTL